MKKQPSLAQLREQLESLKQKQNEIKKLMESSPIKDQGGLRVAGAGGLAAEEQLAQEQRKREQEQEEREEAEKANLLLNGQPQTEEAVPKDDEQPDQRVADQQSQNSASESILDHKQEQTAEER